VKRWFTGADGRIVVDSLNTTETKAEVGEYMWYNKIASLLTHVVVTSAVTMDVEPLWSKDESGFPILGLDGILVKSEPFDACQKVDTPPEEPTEAEELIEEAETNSTKHQKQKWILIADGQGCGIEEKMWNADLAGYSALLVLSPDLEATENSNLTSELRIFPAKISITEGLNLAENYSYPDSYVANLQDLRSTQWSAAIYKIIGVVAAAIIILIAIIYAIVKVVQRRKQNDAEKEEEESRENLHKIIENMPITVWELNHLTKDEKCHICFGLFHQNDIIRTYPCYHRFHQRCIMSRIDNGQTDCVVCHYQLLTPRRKSTESTPLLS